MAPKPFLFEHAFDSPDDVAVPVEEPEAPPMFDEATLEAERQAAYAQGRADGVALMRAEAEAAEAAAASRALEAIAGGVAAALRTAEEAGETALAAAPLATARAVGLAFPAFQRAHGRQEIMATVRDALERAIDEPRLVVRLAEADFEAIEPELAGVAHRAGFPGRIVTLEDAGIAEGDVRVEWADGGLARDVDRLARLIADALGDLAAAHAPQDNPNAAAAEAAGTTAGA